MVAKYHVGVCDAFIFMLDWLVIRDLEQLMAR